MMKNRKSVRSTLHKRMGFVLVKLFNLLFDQTKHIANAEIFEMKTCVFLMAIGDVITITVSPEWMDPLKYF